jgi:hypothetical protein
MRATPPTRGACSPNRPRELSLGYSNPPSPTFRGVPPGRGVPARSITDPHDAVTSRLPRHPRSTDVRRVGVQNACVRPRLRPTRVTAPPRPTVPRAPADTRAPEVVAARTRARRPVGGAIARRGARPGVASRFAGTVSSGNFQRLERTASGFKARSTGSRRGVFLSTDGFF